MGFPSCLIVLILSANALSAADQPSHHDKLIGHRGGVVEDKFPDNSAAALQAAVTRGYWMIETDIRETKDGILVMRHDPDFQAYYHEPRQVRDLTWDEIRLLHSDIADQHPWRFEDLVKAAHEAGLRLMLDSKDPHSAQFCEKVEAILKKFDMVGNCYITGTQDAQDHFLGKAPVGTKFLTLKAKLATDPSAKDKYFLFEHGDMTAEMVKWAQDHNVRIVASINVYHYYDALTMAGKPRAELEKIILAAAHRDIEKLKALGVTEFQIDSEFDGWF